VSTEVAIKTSGVTKIYGNKTVVRDVNMTIYKGDIYGFIGSNGAGKTTFIRCLMGLVNMNKGEVEILGKSSKNIKEIGIARSKVGCIVETPALLNNMNAFDCIKSYSLLYKDASSSKKLWELLELVGLKGTGNKKVKDFSLGMRQRLAIAQALVNEPEILILDEPTNGMDPQGIIEVRKFLHMLRDTKGITILVSSHILGELQQLANRFGIIENGVLKKEIAGTEFASGSTKSVVRISIAANQVQNALQILIANNIDQNSFKVDGTYIDIVEEENFKKVNKLLTLADIDFSIVSKSQVNLEDVFLQVVNKKDGV